jgi:hypothetical protein
VPGWRREGRTRRFLPLDLTAVIILRTLLGDPRASPIAGLGELGEGAERNVLVPAPALGGYASPRSALLVPGPDAQVFREVREVRRHLECIVLRHTSPLTLLPCRCSVGALIHSAACCRSWPLLHPAVPDSLHT